MPRGAGYHVLSLDDGDVSDLELCSPPLARRQGLGTV